MIKYCILYTIAVLNAFNRKIMRYNLFLKKQKLAKKIKGTKIIKKLSARRKMRHSSGRFNA